VSISVLDLFTIGIGPSSSHAVGPMRAAGRFLQALSGAGLLEQVARVQVDLFGSLGATGLGHGTDKATLMGLEGETPERVDPAAVADRVAEIAARQQILLGGQRRISFILPRDLLFHLDSRLPGHPNAMRCVAWNEQAEILLQREYYSVGGGFVVDADEATPVPAPGQMQVPFPFHSAAELVDHCRRQGAPVSEITLRNEVSHRSELEIRRQLLRVWEVMQNCVQRGCKTSGTLPGPLAVERRAPRLFRELTERPEAALRDPLSIVDWVNLYALAVAEENAAGGRVVTAPTNGAAGIIPAVLHYYTRFCTPATEDGVVRFLLTAGAKGDCGDRRPWQMPSITVA
jgi:L-serine dehydratase